MKNCASSPKKSRTRNGCSSCSANASVLSVYFIRAITATPKNLTVPLSRKILRKHSSNQRRARPCCTYLRRKGRDLIPIQVQLLHVYESLAHLRPELFELVPPEMQKRQGRASRQLRWKICQGVPPKVQDRQRFALSHLFF